MSQIFRPRANQLARTSLVGGLVGLFVLAWAIGLLMRSDFVTGANTNVEQPVQFSHAHHVGGLGIDCRYCHTSVDQAAFANIPPTKTCMNCHSQIWATSPYLEPVRASWRTGESLQWVRVHNLPDFVYFNHAIHVKKGIGCETCHGRLDQMPGIYQAKSLQMEWCLDCHRRPEQYVRPREAVFEMGYRPAVSQAVLGPELVKAYDIQSLTTCSVCHR
ncbi:MAG: cytochrome c family protein [Acidobacteria bacterium]|nr:cytochrome c family protein [Acidobacteriota bacterium]